MAKIFINQGHFPGIDPGAVGPSGLQEAVVVQDVGMRVVEYLNAVGHQAIAYQSDSLQDICNQANSWGADLIVSIHCNSFSSAAATGMEIWTSSGQTRADRLATLIMAQMSGEFPILPVRGDWSDGDVDKETGLYVLQNTVAPAVLVELAFISNPSEEAILASAEGKRMFAAAIARGVTDYIVEVGA